LTGRARLVVWALAAAALAVSGCPRPEARGSGGRALEGAASRATASYDPDEDGGTTTGRGADGTPWTATASFRAEAPELALLAYPGAAAGAILRSRTPEGGSIARVSTTSDPAAKVLAHYAARFPEARVSAGRLVTVVEGRTAAGTFSITIHPASEGGTSVIARLLE
jgi:hypothetical protein